jgi:hypothetical protein
MGCMPGTSWAGSVSACLAKRAGALLFLCISLLRADLIHLGWTKMNGKIIFFCNFSLFHCWACAQIGRSMGCGRFVLGQKYIIVAFQISVFYDYDPLMIIL